MWNVIDFVTNSLYVATVALRVVSYFQVILCLFYFVYKNIHFVCPQEREKLLMQMQNVCHSVCGTQCADVISGVNSNANRCFSMFCCRYKKKWWTIRMQLIYRVNSGIHGIQCCYQVCYQFIFFVLFLFLSLCDASLYSWLNQHASHWKVFIVGPQIEIHFN